MGSIAISHAVSCHFNYNYPFCWISSWYIYLHFIYETEFSVKINKGRTRKNHYPRHIFLSSPPQSVHPLYNPHTSKQVFFSVFLCTDVKYSVNFLPSQKKLLPMYDSFSRENGYTCSRFSPRLYNRALSHWKLLSQRRGSESLRSLPLLQFRQCLWRKIRDNIWKYIHFS